MYHFLSVLNLRVETTTRLISKPPPHALSRAARVAYHAPSVTPNAKLVAAVAASAFRDAMAMNDPFVQ